MRMLKRLATGLGILGALALVIFVFETTLQLILTFSWELLGWILLTLIVCLIVGWLVDFGAGVDEFFDTADDSE